MAFAKVGLGTVTRVALGTTSTVYTVGSAKTSYIRSVIVHNIDTVNSSTVKIHIVPNSGVLLELQVLLINLHNFQFNQQTLISLNLRILLHWQVIMILFKFITQVPQTQLMF